MPKPPLLPRRAHRGARVRWLLATLGAAVAPDLASLTDRAMASIGWSRRGPMITRRSRPLPCRHPPAYGVAKPSAKRCITPAAVERIAPS